VDTVSSIKELAAKQFGGDANAIDIDAPVDQLGIDSLGFLEFLFELEDKLGISIPQESVANVKTLRELAAVVDQLAIMKAQPVAASKAQPT
jgi:acyl carrier protein